MSDDANRQLQDERFLSNLGFDHVKQRFSNQEILVNFVTAACQEMTKLNI